MGNSSFDKTLAALYGNRAAALMMTGAYEGQQLTAAELFSAQKIIPPLEVSSQDQRFVVKSFAEWLTQV